MKLFKYFIFLSFLYFSLANTVLAEACDTYDIKRLRVLAKNVEITYEYNDSLYGDDGFKIYDTYKVIINNLTDELYATEDKTNSDYRNYPVVDDSITIDRIGSGKKSFKIYSKNCGSVLNTIYVKLPRFNYYYTDPNCEGKEELDVCKKFYDTSNLEYSDFYNIIVEYENKTNDDNGNNSNDNQSSKNKLDIIKFVKDNYIYFGIGGIAIVLFIIILLIIRHKKRGVLE